ncbi:class I SAM-dependent methyltransferase [Actinoallomurus rhizosphaericola]|uniref:class I SAM-dependent methyltransferase n=1 Tax=Actinoallomurus rhizosphaericola TaxID=2952536 RepID=UPI00209277C3|nr:class I SAM-dependent methyltransferase [Actinoallomurus rhizosphaericola]MCO5999429.1 class I SAM-dependent methyltransferase [Actinoallomurus rhizosphaericola]
MTHTDDHDYWNHNTHYHRLVLDAMPDPCEAALDVGCGEGLLARRLATRVRRVTGVDRSAEMIRRARERAGASGGMEFVAADFLRHPFPEGTYDLVCSVAVIHHMDFTSALTRMADLLRPGGTLVVVGLARNRTPLDWARDVAVLPAVMVVDRVRGKADPAGMPMTAPEMSWGQVRGEALRLLPGARFRRHLYWRYSIRWRKP